MSGLIIERLSPSELPPEWARRLQLKPGQTVTVRIEPDTGPGEIHAEVLAISGLVPADTDAAGEYQAAMLGKHSP